jgi:hypothetical protein
MHRPASFATAAIAVLVLGGCHRGETPNAEKNTTPVTTATPKAAPSTASCAPAPALEASPDLPAIDFARLTSSFAAAYAGACGERLFAGEPLVPANVPHPGKLFVLNAPDANVASIYRGGDDGKGDIVLEYHFAGSDGSHAMPGTDDLHEAIYCAVHGASQTEQDDSGRCLAD